MAEPWAAMLDYEVEASAEEGGGKNFPPVLDTLTLKFYSMTRKYISILFKALLLRAFCYPQ